MVCFSNSTFVTMFYSHYITSTFIFTVVCVNIKKQLSIVLTLTLKFSQLDIIQDGIPL